MKKIALSIGIFLALFIVSCEGPNGPPGPVGPEGLPGLDGIQGQVFEVEGVNFDYDSGNNVYNTVLQFSDFTSFEILDSDAVLVYRFDGQIDFDDGSTKDSWGLIPQNFFLPGGTIQYVTSHTSNDVQIFIDGNFNLANISTEFTDNQIFRVVILPSDFAANAKVDKANIDAVMRTLNLEEKDVRQLR
ncbi:collagen-like protein [Flavobacteriaceae bacterium F89]|uniref:Collagen-like protein n=1 Tax=Cerina litoralis TaxID=2874477 RepID=A0AAE3ER43_9FLAO|nr:collagen-like protein [Cerina litoralis]MCG2459582.1 collagen-like protein [Cerina litoralis]